MKPRDHSFTIVKAMAVLFFVLSQSGGPLWLGEWTRVLGLPVFFICMGYFFHEQQVTAPTTYLWHKVKSIYLPFWGWSFLFLVLHNFFHWIGFVGASGTGAAGLSYGWHEFFQNLWSITFNMSGYDASMCGAYWFFRSLFLASIVFFLGYALISKYARLQDPRAIGGTIAGAALLLALWMVAADLRITGVADGGYRELMAVVLLGVGFLYRQWASTITSSPWFLLGALAVYVAGVLLQPADMVGTADIWGVFSLLFTATGGFIVLHAVATWLATRQHILTRGLVYMGERCLYIIGFYLLAFKLVGMVKLLVYGYSWSNMCDTPVVYLRANDDIFFLFYFLVGAFLPVLVPYLWHKLDKTYNLTWFNCLLYTWKGIRLAANFLWKGIKAVGLSIGRSVKGFYLDMKDFVKASNPKEDE